MSAYTGKPAIAAWNDIYLHCVQTRTRGICRPGPERVSSSAALLRLPVLLMCDAARSCQIAPNVTWAPADAAQRTESLQGLSQGC